MDKRYWIRAKFFLRCSMRCMGIGIYCLTRATMKMVSVHKFAVMSVVAGFLLISNIYQFVGNKVEKTTLAHQNDSLQLSNDTLREMSLYEVGYTAGLKHGSQL